MTASLPDIIFSQLLSNFGSGANQSAGVKNLVVVQTEVQECKIYFANSNLN
jgi:hypothetical protein